MILRHPVVTRAIAHRPLRFLFVGGVNTVFSYAIFTACLHGGLGPSVSLVIATVLGVLFNFITSSALTFRSRDVRRFPAFCLTYAILFVVNLIALQGLVASGIGPAVAQAMLVLPLAALSYVVQRDLVFRIGPRGGRPA